MEFLAGIKTGSRIRPVGRTRHIASAGSRDRDSESLSTRAGGVVRVISPSQAVPARAGIGLGRVRTDPGQLSTDAPPPPASLRSRLEERAGAAQVSAVAARGEAAAQGEAAARVEASESSARVKAARRISSGSEPRGSTMGRRALATATASCQCSLASLSLPGPLSPPLSVFLFISLSLSLSVSLRVSLFYTPSPFLPPSLVPFLNPFLPLSLPLPPSPTLFFPLCLSYLSIHLRALVSFRISSTILIYR